MAKKPATTPTQELPPAMDYAQHNGTYQAFMGFLKWTALALLIVVIALYCFIEAQQPILGTLLLFLIPVGVIGLVVMGTRRS